jgi:hypothetical protein
MPDVFISLSSKDRSWGDWIAWQLREAGYDVGYAYWQLQPGENLYERTENWVHDASRVVVLVSPSYFASEQTRRELDQAVSRDPSGRKGIVVPVKISEQDVSGRQLGILLQIDLTGIASEAEARKRLLDGLAGNHQPASAPAFPIGESPQPKPEYPAPSANAGGDEGAGQARAPEPGPASSSPHPAFPPARAFMRKFARNAAICLLVQAVLYLPVLRQVRKPVDDAVGGKIFQLPAAFQILTRQAGDVAYTFIDIDDETYGLWRKPKPLPRRELLQLLRYAVEGGARLVILDVELSARDPREPGQQELDTYLSEHRNTTPPMAPIVLVRSLQAISSKAQAGSCPELESAVPDSPGVVLATPSLEAKNTVLFPLWEIVCGAGTPEPLPSVALFANAWLKSGSHGTENLKQWLEARRPADCASCDAHFGRPDNAHDLLLGDLRISGAGGALARVRYLIPWRRDAGQRTVSNGRETPLLYVEAAYRIAGTGTAPSFDLVKDRVAIIGSSFGETRDTKSTPLGEMPGPMALMNAIESLGRFGALNPPNFVVSGSLAALWDINVSLVFAACGQLRQGAAASSVVGAALLVLSLAGALYTPWSILAAPAALLWFRETRPGSRVKT